MSIIFYMWVLPWRRYQMVAGMDRYLFGHSNLLWSYLVASSVVRVMSHAVSQQSRLFFMGLPTQPPPEESPSAADAADAFRRWRLALPSRRVHDMQLFGQSRNPSKQSGSNIPIKAWSHPESLATHVTLFQRCQCGSNILINTCSTLAAHAHA